MLPLLSQTSTSMFLSKIWILSMPSKSSRILSTSTILFNLFDFQVLSFLWLMISTILHSQLHILSPHVILPSATFISVPQQHYLSCQLQPTPVSRHWSDILTLNRHVHMQNAEVTWFTIRLPILGNSYSSLKKRQSRLPVRTVFWSKVLMFCMYLV